MAVTLMLFVRLPKAHTSARVKQALKEMENTAKVICLLFVELFDSHSYLRGIQSLDVYALNECRVAFGWVICLQY